jgi:hypothetical protein
MMLVLKILVMMLKDVNIYLSIVPLHHAKKVDVIPLVGVFTGIRFVMIMIPVQPILV